MLERNTAQPQGKQIFMTKSDFNSTDFLELSVSKNLKC